MHNSTPHAGTTILELEQIVTKVEMEHLRCMVEVDLQGFNFPCNQPAILIDLESELAMCLDCFHGVPGMERGIYGALDAYDMWMDN